MVFEPNRPTTTRRIKMVQSSSTFKKLVRICMTWIAATPTENCRCIVFSFEVIPRIRGDCMVLFGPTTNHELVGSSLLLRPCQLNNKIEAGASQPGFTCFTDFASLHRMFPRPPAFHLQGQDRTQAWKMTGFEISRRHDAMTVFTDTYCSALLPARWSNLLYLHNVNFVKKHQSFEPY